MPRGMAASVSSSLTENASLVISEGGIPFYLIPLDSVCVDRAEPILENGGWLQREGDSGPLFLCWPF